MRSLTEVYATIEARDPDLEKQAAQILAKQAEAEKLAQEEEFAGRIMARGFAAELHKLAEANLPKPIGSGGGTVKTTFGATPAGMTGGMGGVTKRQMQPPSTAMGAGRFTRGSQGGYGNTNLSVTSGALGAPKPKPMGMAAKPPRPAGGGGSGAAAP